MATFQDRVVGALKLQASTYDEVERDGNATGQAALVVALASLAGALVVLRFGWISIAVRMVIAGLVGWAVSALVIWLLGTRGLPGKNTQADYWQVLRPVGFAQAPGIFMALAVLPFLGWLVALVVSLWMLAALVVATRQALDYDDTMKAVIVVVLAFVALWVVRWVLGAGYGFGYGLGPY
jgi:hypothetical protein